MNRKMTTVALNPFTVTIEGMKGAGKLCMSGFFRELQTPTG